MYQAHDGRLMEVFALEFVNILLQMVAQAVKNASSLLFSGHSELEYTLITLLKVPTNSKVDYCSKVLRCELRKIPFQSVISKSEGI